MNADPIGISDGVNVYWYSHNNPVINHDLNGTETGGSGKTISPEERENITNYFNKKREYLKEVEYDYRNIKESGKAFVVYRAILDDLEAAILSGRQSLDLNGLWKKAREHGVSWRNQSWRYLCSKCQEKRSFHDAGGPFGHTDLKMRTGVDVEAVFSAVINDEEPNPSLAKRAIRAGAEIALGLMLMRGGGRVPSGGAMGSRLTTGAELGGSVGAMRPAIPPLAKKGPAPISSPARPTAAEPSILRGQPVPSSPSPTTPLPQTAPVSSPGQWNLSELMTGTRFKPTQKDIYRGTVEKMAQAMRAERFKWSGMDDPIIVSTRGDILQGHHRIVAARLAGKPIPESAIKTIPGAVARDPRPWGSVTLKPGERAPH